MWNADAGRSTKITSVSHHFCGVPPGRGRGRGDPDIDCAAGHDDGAGVRFAIYCSVVAAVAIAIAAAVGRC